MNNDRSSHLPSIDSFQFHVPLTSTPKRTTRSSHPQPLSSTLSISTDSCRQLELSISAITSSQSSPRLTQEKHPRGLDHRRRNRIHPSTIIKRIELKYLLYSARTMKLKHQRQYTETERKVYMV